MSYDIFNYAFLALPVEKVCESLDYNTPVPLGEEISNDLLLTVRAVLKRSKAPTAVLDFVLGPFRFDRNSLCFYLDGEPVELTRRRQGLSGVEGVDTLASLSQVLASEGKLTVYPRHTTTVQVACLKTALEKLLAMHAASAEHNVRSIQGCMQILLEKFLESKECYCTIDVTSRMHCNCHDSGGMGDGVYVVYGDGAKEPYDENGWTDPRREDAETLAEARNHLLGGSDDLDWEKFTPQFGG